MKSSIESKWFLLTPLLVIVCVTLMIVVFRSVILLF